MLCSIETTKSELINSNSSETYHYVMTYIRKFTRKNKDGTIRTYYGEVESIRVGDKVIQKYIRSLGADPNTPTNFLIESVHFSYLAVRLMQGDLTPNEVFEMLEG